MTVRFELERLRDVLPTMEGLAARRAAVARDRAALHSDRHNFVESLSRSVTAGHQPSPMSCKDVVIAQPGATFGVNYVRQTGIKARPDPTNLFRHNTNFTPATISA